MCKPVHDLSTYDVRRPDSGSILLQGVPVKVVAQFCVANIFTTVGISYSTGSPLIRKSIQFTFIQVLRLPAKLLQARERSDRSLFLLRLREKSKYERPAGLPAGRPW